MESIRAIQEIIDENKEEMPTGVVTRVMNECQKAYDTQPQLYKLSWTTVDSHAHVVHCEEDEEDFAEVKLSHKTQTLIVEAVDGLVDRHPKYGGKPSSVEMPHHGTVLKSWVDMALPTVIMYGEDSMAIIHSIVPYKPRKRARDEDEA